MTPEEYVQRHKKAFRVAFDYLNDHFPPGEDDDWWERAAMDASRVYAENGCDPLQLQLLAGVCEYLETEWKERRKENEQRKGA